jgi:hypothetical protein
MTSTTKHPSPTEVKACVHYRDIITGTEVVFGNILPLTRAQAAAILVGQYLKDHPRKRATTNLQDYFQRCPTLYWGVRDLIEKFESPSFDGVVEQFKALYPLASEDWKCALELGLLIKANMREGNHTTTPFVYEHDPLAAQIRGLNLNEMKSFVSSSILG